MFVEQVARSLGFCAGLRSPDSEVPYAIACTCPWDLRQGANDVLLVVGLASSVGCSSGDRGGS
jgi:hypothetical protein